MTRAPLALYWIIGNHGIVGSDGSLMTRKIKEKYQSAYPRAIFICRRSTWKSCSDRVRSLTELQAAVAARTICGARNGGGHTDRKVFPKVRILGPARRATQLEISRTDAFTLGIDPLQCGNRAILREHPGIRIVGPAGEVTVEEGVIVAARHIHFHTSDAEKWGITDKQMLKVRVGGERGVHIRAGACAGIGSIRAGHAYRYGRRQRGRRYNRRFGEIVGLTLHRYPMATPGRFML